MSDSARKYRPPVDYIVKTEKPLDELDTPLGRVRIGPYEPGDEHSILDLFKLVFKVDRSLEQWHWEFRDHPVGMHTYLGKLDDGQVVSQFTGLPARAKVFDRDLIFSQIVDSMVHPKCREGLKKKGLFALTLLNHSHHFGHLEKECVQMGLPNPIAYRLGSQTCYYVPMTKAYVHAKELKPAGDLGEPSLELKGLGNSFRAALVEDFSADHDDLWARVKERHRIITWRDRRFWNWRYTRNPHFRYLILELRDPDSGRLAATAVCRSEWLGQPDFAIADLLVDLEMTGAAQALIKGAEELGRRTGMSRVVCFLNHNVPESRVFEDEGYMLAPIAFRLVSHSYAPDFVTERELMHEWYYGLGDFDVI
ncbi:MAG: GNAT family N-acetyltransferase [Planctomycetes bacterium]|nr:GNAT family N-acetyltransferase [Planctomycetota bacterium]